MDLAAHRPAQGLLRSVFLVIAVDKTMWQSY